MNFHRTPSGLGNLYLFFKVERIVYCEGGSQLTVMAIEAGDGDEETLDVQFWQSLFLNFGSRTTAHVKSIGSKTTLLAIAQSVMASNLGRVFVCLDRDFDDFGGTAVQDPRIIYSFGYSFENDVLQPEILEDTFFLLRAKNAQSIKDWDAAKAKLSSFLKKIERYCNYDLHFVCNGGEGLFIRPRGAGCLNVAPPNAPKLNEAILKQRLQQRGFARGPRPKQKIVSTEIARRMYGKMLASFSYHLVAHSVAKGNNTKTPFDSFMRIAITKLVDRLRNNQLPNLTTYYASIIP